jgi:hypothetical protein
MEFALTGTAFYGVHKVSEVAIVLKVVVEGQQSE